MCEQCVVLDGKIAHYREMARLITDPLTLEGIDILIKRYEAEKTALHPQQG